MIRMPKPYDGMFGSWKWQADIEQVVDQSSKFFFGIFFCIPIRLSPFHQSDLQKILVSFFSRVFSRPSFSRKIAKWVLAQTVSSTSWTALTLDSPQPDLWR